MTKRNTIALKSGGFLIALFLSHGAYAEAKQEDSILKDWTLSSGFIHSKSKRTKDVSLSSNRANTFILSGVKRHDNKTYYGGSLAYSLGTANTASDNGETDTQVVSGSLFGMRLIDNLIMLNANISHGGVSLDNTHFSGANTVTFESGSSFWALGAGATKIIPLGKEFTATASANYNFNYSDSDSYKDSSNARTSGETSTRSMITLGSGVNWRIDDKWTPNAKLNWHYSSRSLYSATEDKDYFSYAVGTSYAIQPDTKISVAYSSAFAKTETREHAFSLTVSWTF